MLLFKLCITPLLMGIATLVARRWGPVVGGIFTALPLTAGPVSAFLFAEQGLAFALDAVCASMLGYAALTFFIMVFVELARRGLGLVLVCLGSSLTYFAVASLFSLLPRSPTLCLVVALASLVIGMRCIPHTRVQWHPVRMAWWDLPARMLAAGGLVLGITGIASIIGPQWSGFLATFPVFITLLAVFTLVQAGQAPLRMLMRGFVGGLFGSLAFFYVLLLALPAMHVALAYTLAAVVNLAVSGADLWLSSHSLRALLRLIRARKHRN